MRQTILNRLSELEERLQPLAPTEPPAPMQIWRVSKTTPRLYRLEDGGAWLTESEYQAQMPPAKAGTGKRLRAPALVEIHGDWKDIPAHYRNINNIQ